MLALLLNFRLGTIDGVTGRARRQRLGGSLPVHSFVWALLLLLGARALAQPTITGISPVPNVRAAGGASPVSITFSQPLLGGSAAALQVFSSQRGGRRTSGTPAVVSGSTLTFTPSAYDFRPGETVFRTVTTGASSSSGSLAVPWVGQFTVAVGGTGTGTFGGHVLNPEVPMGASTNPLKTALGDVDADGDLDMLTACFGSGTVEVRLNDGTGNYAGGGVISAVGAYHLALGDVDADGDLDFVTANYAANTARTWLNNGAGSFAGGAVVAVGTQPDVVALGDVDGDGDLDLLTANYGSLSVSVRLNSGSGSFGGGSTVAVGNSPFGLTLGDVDNDGDLDILTANGTSASVSVRLNDGSGSFGGGSDVALGGTPFDVALGDVDGDGDLDFAALNLATSVVHIRLNNGAGSFAGGTNPAVGGSPYSLALGDVDHDGDLDLLVPSAAANAVSVALNNGSGSFVGGSNVTVGTAPYSVTLGDVDSDGDLDFVTANLATNTVSVRLNQPPPVLLTFTPNTAVAGTTVAVTGTDLLGLTSFTVNGANAFGSITGLTATGFSFVVPPGCTPTGTSTANNPFGSSNYTSFVALLRLTGSSPAARVSTAARANSAVSLTFTEPVTTGSLAAAAGIYSAQQGGRKAGTWSTAGSTASYGSSLPASRRDFRPGETVRVSVPAGVQSAGGISVKPQVLDFTTAVGGTGVGLFVPHGSTPEAATDSGPQAVALADVDGDGDLDLLTANYNAATVSVRLNGGNASGGGNGAFSNGTNTPVGTDPRSIAVGDVDGDGDLDFVTGNRSANTVSVRLNGGNASGSNTGIFSNGSNPMVASSPESVALADVDGDGDLDLLCAAYYGNVVSIRLNGGDATGSNTGVFSAGSDAATAPYPTGLAVGDVDGDGDLDFVTANLGDNTVSIRLNGGDATGSNTGVFSGGTNLAMPTGPRAITLADVDGDGDLDYVVANYFTSNISIRLNGGDGAGAGTGVFSNGSDVVLSYYPIAVALGDVDADGDLDFIAANFGTNTISLRKNGGDASGSNTGIFSGGADLPVGSYPSDVALGDVDGDGDLDFATANWGAATASVRMNAGRPTIVSFLPARAAAGTTVAVTGFDLSGLTAWTVNGINAFPSVTGLTATGFSFVVPPSCTPSGTSTATTGFGSGSSTGFTALLKVVSSNPVANAAAAPANIVALALTFTEPLNSGAANNLKVFASQAGGLKPGGVSVSGSTASYASSLPGVRARFRPGEAVQVTVPTSVTSAGGGIGAEPWVYQFTTAVGGTGIGNFQPPSSNANPAVGGAVPDVALGDVDGDGDLDFVASLPASNAVRLRLNNGAGSFTGGGALISVGTGPVGVVLADVDGDGDFDLLTTNATANTVSVRLNNGAGSFGGGSDFAVGNNAQHLRLSDVDGDGDLDLLVANFGANTVSVRLNNGSGSFSGGSDVAVNTNPFDVALGDFDGDGDLDFVATNYASGTVSLRFNDGLGNFGGGSNPSFGSGGPAGLALGDFDGDGDLDFACPRNISGNTVVVWLNTGSGASFSATAVSVGSLPLAIGAADVDHDGDLDLLTTNTGSATVSVLLNNGAGSFSPPAYNPSPPVGGSPAGLALGDVDGDGDVDLVSADNSSGTGAVSVRFNQPPPPPTIISFTPPAAVAGTTVAVTGTTLSDLTNWTVNGINAFASVTGLTATGFSFVVPPGCTPSGSSTATTLWGSGSSGGFTALLEIVSTNPAANAVAAPPAVSAVGLTFTEPVTSISAARLRVFSSQLGGRKNGTVSTSGSAAHYVSTLPVPSNAFRPGERVSVTVPANVLSYGGIAANGRVYQFDAAVTGAGAGDFITPSINPNPGVGGAPIGVALGDVDGDGDLDLVAANSLSGSVSVRFNTGPANFAFGADVAVGNEPVSVALADIDADGDLDFVAANRSDNTVSVRFNDGLGNFAALTADVAVGTTPRAVVVGDVDADGDLDLLTANSGSNTVSVRLNDGFGNFSPGTDPSVGAQPAGLALGDVDADGDLDVVTANAGANTVSIRLNDGAGVFSGGTDPAVGTQPRGVAVGDLDADGDLDLVTANFAANSLSIRFNNGAGTFSGSTSVAAGTGAFSVTLGDVDTDGDLDALTTNYTANTVSVRLNDGSGTFTSPSLNPNPFVGSNPAGLALGDIDADGDLDFVASKSTPLTNTVTVTVRLNKSLRPLLLTVTPAAELAGLPLTLFGADFTPSCTVTVGGVAASVVFHTSSHLTAFVPVGVPAGPAPVVVTTATGSSPLSPPFTVLTVFDAFGTSCQSSVPYVATGDGRWHYLLATNGQVVAALLDSHAPLDTVAVQHRALGSAAPVRADGYGRYYLDRDFHLTTSGGPFTGTTVQVRFFGLNAEMARLQAADASVTYPTLKLTQYSGPREDCELTNDDFAAGDFRVLAAPASTPGGAVPWFVADVSIADHFSEFFLTGSSEPLPVELSRFGAWRVAPDRVQLTWATASERRNRGFVVERSADGRQFAAVSGLLPGAGTNSAPHAYAWPDSAAPAGWAYYRLRQLDDDDSPAVYSGIVPVAPAPAAGLPQLTLWPNPAHNAVQVAGAEPCAALLLLDATGRVVRELTATANGTATVPLVGLPAGVYGVRTPAGRFARLVID